MKEKAAGMAAADDAPTLSERVYLSLADDLMAGRYAPGARLVITKIADELGVSAMPVREALKRLASENALAMEPNRSVCVPVISLEELDHLTDIRLLLEGRAAELAADNITRKELDALKTWQDAIEKAMSKADARVLLSANQKFHFAIYTAARSDLLMRHIRSLWMRAGPLFHDPEAGEVLEGALAESFEAHYQVMDALERRHGASAKRAVQADITRTRDDLRRRLAGAAQEGSR